MYEREHACRLERYSIKSMWVHANRYRKRYGVSIHEYTHGDAEIMEETHDLGVVLL